MVIDVSNNARIVLVAPALQKQFSVGGPRPSSVSEYERLISELGNELPDVDGGLRREPITEGRRQTTLRVKSRRA
ncbi:hypothetical protein ABIF29_005613 [Bradyrhizobium elkanii]|uniref:Uncharacterized protein n=1 Tax=Bradyrhizobium elkanii TaxID=29448 RepID=A0ABV4F6S5_BRAEL|nr:hypothetical protein [Bradyrhizobium elkanii]MCS3889325.1 hypothetical protein [Bradyrhizobium elkanii]MCS4211654.1 hypothetical protein [Bradyrhizobium elkanii]MCW2211960.1 hypothetical protein [Bradyrhizobium elkanii]NWL66690.1 hypothetical protein [Bradyrhizobium elkanii]